MAEQLLSSDPDAGLLSTDPNAAQSQSVGQRFASGVAQNLNPMGMVRAAMHPVDTLGAIIDAHVEQAKKAKAAYDQGRYSEAAGHLGAAALPILGPAAANAGERIGSGDIAGGLGEATGLLAGTVAGPAVARTVGQRLGAISGSVGPAAEVARDVVSKKLGLSTEAQDLATARMRLQAAKSRTRIAQGEAKLATSSPAAAPVAESAPPSAAPVPQPQPSAPPPASAAAPASPPAATALSGPELKVGSDLVRAGFSPEEAGQAIQWRKQGVPSETIMARLQALQALRQGSGPFQQLPTTLEAAQAVERRNTTGKWE